MTRRLKIVQLLAACSAVLLLTAGCGGDEGPLGETGTTGEIGKEWEEGPQGEPGAEGPAGEEGPQGDEGPQGEDGETGPAALVDIVDEPAGENCAEGGKAVYTGHDTNGNGELDEDEAGDPTYVCQGVAGSTGPDGEDGLDGGTELCDGRASLEITGVENVPERLFEDTESAPLELASNAADDLSLTFLSASMENTYTDLGDNTFTVIPGAAGTGAETVAIIATDGCTTDAIEFSLPSVEEAIALVRALHAASNAPAEVDVNIVEADGDPEDGITI